MSSKTYGLRLRQAPAPPQRRGYYTEDGRFWVDAVRGRSYRLLDDADTLEIEIEDAGGHSFVGSLLAVFAAPQWHGLYRFAAVAQSPDARWPRYVIRSGTFVAPRPVPEPAISLREEWAPDMASRLAELREELTAEGWLLAGHGERSWSFRYMRPRSMLDLEG